MVETLHISSSLCVIFDLDGTLVDSESLCCRAFVDLLPKLDDSLDILVRRYRGQKLSRVLADIETRLNTNLPTDFNVRYRARVQQLFDAELQPVPGVPEMLETLNTSKCVASSGPRAKIHQALSVTGLSAHFGDALFSSYDVGSWKPEPGIFTHAAAAMGREPKDCIVVEDSDVGVDAALAAGMRVVRFDPDRSNKLRHGVNVIKRMEDLPEMLTALMP